MHRHCVARPGVGMIYGRKGFKIIIPGRLEREPSQEHFGEGKYAQSFPLLPFSFASRPTIGIIQQINSFKILKRLNMT